MPLGANSNTLLCLCVVLSLAIAPKELEGFGMEARIECSDGDRDRLMVAVKEACKYDFFIVPLIVQRIFTAKKEEAILFEPLSADSAAADVHDTGWRAEVRFLRDSHHKPLLHLTEKNPVRSLKLRGGAARVNAAVLAACTYLDERRELRLPVVISVSRAGRRFMETQLSQQCRATRKGQL